MVKNSTVSFLVLLVSSICLSFACDSNKDTHSDYSSGIGLKNLKPDHPRLLFTNEDLERIQTLANSDRDLQIIIANVIQSADEVIDEPVAKYNVVDSRPRLLHESRAVLSRIQYLAMAYRITGHQKYLNRAVLELKTAAAFPDWNPRHFLDTGEMTTAFAIGYDWLYDDLSEEDRKIIREAIVNHGLKAGLDAYANDAVWVERKPSNWNQVCNAGLSMGALAIADEEPEIARQILEKAKASIPNGMNPYTPDGAYKEGPMYWWYGTAFNVLLINSLQTALNTDWDLTSIEGFHNTASYIIHATSPTQLLFNYGDSSDSAKLTPMLFWFAKQYGNQHWADYHRSMLVDAINNDYDHQFNRLSALDVAWYQSPANDNEHIEPLDAVFRSQGDVAMMRSDWEDPNALFTAFQGIWNQVPHAKLDHGSFVLDADGVRWARHPGTESYSMPDFWDYSEGGVRWTYYRNSSLSHNTLSIDGQLQRAEAKGSINSYGSEPNYAFAVMDLSETYAGQAEKVARGIAMLDRSRVLVQDELTLVNDTSTVRWAMVTEAEVQLDGPVALLTQDGRTLNAEILSPEGASFELVSTDSGDERQRSNEGTVMLATKVNGDDSRMVRIAVLLTPVGEKWPEKKDPVLRTLDNW
ncbi:MAG: DUF4962 domain-containing protein [Balneolales bacterium]